jgi:serine/threonine protein kinase
MKKITEGLIYLHDKKIIHRDIKPENILLMNGIPKIGDLGMATVMKSSGASTKIGTEFYLAPEMYVS